MSCVKSTVAAILQAARLKAQYGAVLTAPEGPAEMDVDKHACDPIETGSRDVSGAAGKEMEVSLLLLLLERLPAKA